MVYSDRACPLVVVEFSHDLDRYHGDIVGEGLDLGEGLWRDREYAGVLQSVQARLEQSQVGLVLANDIGSALLYSATCLHRLDICGLDLGSARGLLMF